MGLQGILKALLHGNWNQRRMAVLFFVSLAGAALSGGVATSRYLEARRIARERAERMAGKDTSCVEMSCAFNAMEELAQKKAALAEIRDATVSLGEFEVGLVGLGDGRQGRSGMSLEVELAIEFDSGQTGRWVAANLSPARNEVLGSIGTLTGLTREDLLTPEGKAKVREQIRERVDSWLPSGKIKGIYFSKFLLQ
jgi:Flagellar basal body-associated protein FliL